MANNLIQPKGSVSKETNKQSIARLFNMSDEKIGYIYQSSDITNFSILFEPTSETLWNNTGSGNVTGFVINSNSLSLSTSVGNYTLFPASVYDISISNVNQSIRSVSSKLRDIPSILDWDSDSANDDSTRISKAVAAGCESLYIPDRKIVDTFKIANVDITNNMKIYGNGIAGYRQVGGCFQVLDDADYGLFFKGTSSNSRIIGGGLDGVSMIGETSANKSTFVKVEHGSSMQFNNVSFRQSGGSAIYMQDFMESRIENCYFNSMGSDTSNVIHIGDYMDSAPWNVNNLHIQYNTFGSCSGYWVYASNNSNSDLIWVDSNKFEWDSTPVNANSTSKSVIYIGGTERFYVINNGFVYFYPSHNMYESIIEVGSNANYGIELLGNMAWGCTNANYWNIKGGSVLATNNKSNANMSTVNSSKYSQDIENPVIRTTTGNRPTSYYAKQYDSNFTPAHYLTGPNDSNNFTTDTNAVINNTCQVAAVSTEVRRIYIPKDMVASKRVIKVTARVKNVNTTDSQIQLLCDGSAISNLTSSMSDSLTYKTIAASSDWSTYTWYISPALITNVGALIIRNNSSTTTFLFDGVSVEYAEFIDITIPWTPGTVAAGSLVNTTATMTRLGPYISGVSQAYANNSAGGGILASYFNGNSNNLVVQVGAITAATTIFTSVTVRVFLK